MVLKVRRSIPCPPVMGGTWASAGGIGETQVPEPVSPRSRSRVGEWDTGAGADVGHRCRTFTLWRSLWSGAEGVRTPDPRLAKPVLYQLSYRPQEDRC